MPGSLFLWGLVALLQMVFLPGYLAIRALRLRAGVVESLLLGFGLSTLINWLLLTILVSLKSYTQARFGWVIAVEALIWIVLWWRDSEQGWWKRSANVYKPAIEAWTAFSPLERGVVVSIGILALYCLFSLIYTAAYGWQDGGFLLWDNVFSWNRWATEWAQDKPPFHTFHYPQLLPSNSSIAYVLMGTRAVQSFSRLFFAFFPIGLFICLIDFGIRKKDLGYWLGIPLCFAAYFYMAPPGPMDGYADVPAAFLIVLTVYCIMVAVEQRDQGQMVLWILCAGLVAAATALTKQTGFYLLAALPFLMALLIPSNEILPKRMKVAAIVWAMIIALGVSMPWYIVKEIQIHHGKEISEVTGVVYAHQGRGKLARMAYAVELMRTTWGTAQTAVVAGLALLLIAIRKPWRWVMVWLVLPGSLIWSVTTSYDLRNSTFFVTLSCACAGLTTAAGIAWVRQRWTSWHPGWRRLSVAAACVGVAIALSYLPTNSTASLIYRSDQAQRTAAMPQVDEVLYKMLRDHRMTKPIVTNYHIMSFLPLMQSFAGVDGFTDPKAFDAIMKQLNPDFILEIWPQVDYGPISPKIIDRNVMEGRWSIEERGSGFLILRTHATPLPPSAREINFGAYTVSSGLDLEEGPYPQWKLPVVRWGAGPATVLEFDSEIERTMQLTMQCPQAGSPNLVIDIKLNGAPIDHQSLGGKPWPVQLKYDLPARAGTNKLEITYSTWEKGDSRRLALMYRVLQILPK